MSVSPQKDHRLKSAPFSCSVPLEDKYSLFGQHLHTRVCQQCIERMCLYFVKIQILISENTMISADRRIEFALNIEI